MLPYFMASHSVSLTQLLKKLSVTNTHGLSSEEVIRRRILYGENKLPETSAKTIWQILWHQFHNALTYILLLATILSLLSDHLIDAVVIGILIVINMSVGVFHEFRAEKRVQSLKQLVTLTCRVRRNGKIQLIQLYELVPGDIVLLEDGQTVPADIRLLDSRELSTEEASLTGESLPILKQAKELPIKTALGDRINMVFMSTHVVSGKGEGVVVAIGEKTEIGKISKQLQTTIEQKSLFHQRTEFLLKQMILVATLLSVVIGFLLFSRGENLSEILSFVFATIISGIPEGLPSVLTVLLSIASVRMSRKKALLRNLPAIETLSTVTTIITDKTGTLTENVMKVEKLLFADRNPIDITGKRWELTGKFLRNKKSISTTEMSGLKRLFSLFALTSIGEITETESGPTVTGYPTEVARYVVARKAGYTRTLAAEHYELLTDTAYNQDSKTKSALFKEKATGKFLFVLLGGAEAVLANCKNAGDLVSEVERAATKGYRMQAVAYTQISQSEMPKTVPKTLELGAVLQIADPLREEVPAAITAAHTAGIRVIMATGDHVATAFEIARKSGIIDPATPISQLHTMALSQTDIDELSAEEFAQKVRTINVFARVTPETKLRIAQVLQQEGQVIAMTGDGVNDAPVIKQADIGIAMGLMGTDVAKESSDLILLDDSFATIIDAIQEGRTVFKNMRQTSLYLITTNLAEYFLIFVSFLFATPLPLLPLQILWLNLVTDGLSDVALATEKSHKTILKEKPRLKTDAIITKKDLVFILTLAVLMMGLGMLFFLPYLTESVDKARTMVFAVMVFTQLFNVYNLRSLETPTWKLGYFSNPAINAAVAISSLLFLGAMYTPTLQPVFGFIPLTLWELAVVILVSGIVLLVGELYKTIRAKKLSL